jgi:hypothetical protein
MTVGERQPPFSVFGPALPPQPFALGWLGHQGKPDQRLTIYIVK